MALIRADRVRESSTSSGTGAKVLSGAAQGYQAIGDVAATNDTLELVVTDDTNWEVGLYTFDAGTNTVTSSVIYDSSNGGAAVNFSGTLLDIFNDIPAHYFNNLPAGGTVTSIATTSPITGGTITTTGTIGITQSGVATDGYLSSTDWNTFNNKQPAGSYVPYTGATSDVDIGSNALVTTTVQADGSGGLALKTNSGTTALLAGAGGGANGTLYGGWNYDNGTANTLVSLGASKTFTSLDTATYPSLTEVSYVKGVTSAIQTQINAKGSGTVTSVAALTLGTTGTDLSSSVADSTTTPVITLNVPTASAANRGALSSADWSTFNAKQSAITFGTGVQTALGVNIGSAGAPVLFDGALGTPSSGVATNLTGTAAGLTAGTVATNANLTGVVTSVGNATAIADAALSIAKTSGLQTALDGKQATLVSGTNIRTVNGSSLLGSGNLSLGVADGSKGDFITVSGGGDTWDINNLAITNAQINDVAWSKVTSTPTTVAGYGITDGANTALSNLSSVAINTSLLPGTSDGGALGSITKMWSDLFLASGGVINWNNGDVVITHSANNIDVSGGTLSVGAATVITGSGSSNRLAFFNGTNSITGLANLTFDSGSGTLTTTELYAEAGANEMSLSGISISFNSSTYLLADYLNFSSTTGSGGFGLRNNAGTIQVKNSGGSWAAIGSGVTGTGSTGYMPYWDSSSSLSYDASFSFSTTTKLLTAVGYYAESGDVQMTLTGENMVWDHTDGGNDSILSNDYVGFNGATYLLHNYLNFSSTTGSGGFGLRNNSGVLEGKNSGGAWSPLVCSNTAFGASWDGETTIAPSKNAVYDAMPRYCVATDSTITSTTLVDIPGLTLPLTAGTWHFEAMIFGNSGNVNGARFGVNYTGTTTSIEANFSGQLNTTTWAATARITALNTASTTVGTTISAELRNMISGTIVVTTAGNLTIKGLKVTSGTFFHRSSSSLMAVRIA